MFRNACSGLMENPLALAGGEMLATLVKLQLQRSALWLLPPTTFQRLDLQPNTVVEVKKLVQDQEVKKVQRLSSTYERNSMSATNVYTYPPPRYAEKEQQAKEWQATEPTTPTNFVLPEEYRAVSGNAVGKTKAEVEAVGLQDREKARHNLEQQTREIEMVRS